MTNEHSVAFVRHPLTAADYTTPPGRGRHAVCQARVGRCLLPAGRLVSALALAVIAAACGGVDESASPTSPTSGIVFTTRFYTGVIESGGSASTSFNVAVGGPVSVTLASITSAATGLPIGRPLRVGVGRVLDEVCTVDASAPVEAGLVMQFVHLAPGGLTCVEVADTIGLPGPIRFALRYTHP